MSGTNGLLLGTGRCAVFIVSKSQTMDNARPLKEATGFQGVSPTYFLVAFQQSRN